MNVLQLTGQLHWQSTGEQTDQNWAVVSGLTPGVIYEMRVVAKNGDGEGSLETSSPVRRVRIGVRRGLYSNLLYLLGLHTQGLSLNEYSSFQQGLAV